MKLRIQAVFFVVGLLASQVALAKENAVTRKEYHPSDKLQGKRASHTQSSLQIFSKRVFHAIQQEDISAFKQQCTSHLTTGHRKPQL